MFPREEDPKGDPETWSREELRRWLAAVCCLASWHGLILTSWPAEPPSSRVRQPRPVARAGAGEFEDSEELGLLPLEEHL